MGVVNQRVCDLPKCSQPITEETEVIFVVPEDKDGKPDLSRKAEFHTPKCSRAWTRTYEVSQTEAGITAAIAALPNNAANKEKIAALNKRLKGKPEVDFPKAA